MSGQALRIDGGKWGPLGEQMLEGVRSVQYTIDARRKKRIKAATLMVTFDSSEGNSHGGLEGARVKRAYHQGWKTTEFLSIEECRLVYSEFVSARQKAIRNFAVANREAGLRKGKPQRPREAN